MTSERKNDHFKKQHPAPPPQKKQLKMTLEVIDISLNFLTPKLKVKPYFVCINLQNDTMSSMSNINYPYSKTFLENLK